MYMYNTVVIILMHDSNIILLTQSLEQLVWLYLYLFVPIRYRGGEETGGHRS